MYRSVNSMIQGLSAEGLVFTSSQQSLTGQYAPADAEWNYKDVPHLKEIHNQVEGIPGAITTEYWVGFFIQKIGPIRVPITVFNYGADPFSNIYFGAVGPFALIISTNWQDNGNSTTTVVTQYNLGSARYLRWMHGIVHKVLARNYKVLMEADTPMRLRRGELRSRGYTFAGDETGHGFIETINLQTVGVMPPSSAKPFSWVSEADKLPQGSTFVGTDDVGGVRIIRENDKVFVFPRVCLHAGASLDDAKIDGDCIVCPWHGKRIQPLSVLMDAKPVSTDNSRGVVIKVENRALFIDGSLTL
jgi:nitrite reductase/ring-hydroxylating ferredoxin subunit